MTEAKKHGADDAAIMDQTGDAAIMDQTGHKSAAAPSSPNKKVGAARQREARALKRQRSVTGWAIAMLRCAHVPDSHTGVASRESVLNHRTPKPNT